MQNIGSRFSLSNSCYFVSLESVAKCIQHVDLAAIPKFVRRPVLQLVFQHLDLLL